MHIKTHNAKNFEQSKLNASQKKKRTKNLSSRKVQVYKIVPYNVHHLGMLFEKKKGPPKISIGIQTEVDPDDVMSNESHYNHQR